jgi:hypothetical protein
VISAMLAPLLTDFWSDRHETPRVHSEQFPYALELRERDRIVSVGR